MDEETIKKIDHIVEVYKKYVEQLEKRIEELEAANGELNEQLEDLKNELEKANESNPFSEDILEKIREAQKNIPQVPNPPYTPNPYNPPYQTTPWTITSGSSSASASFNISKDNVDSVHNDWKSFINGVENG